MGQLGSEMRLSASFHGSVTVSVKVRVRTTRRGSVRVRTSTRGTVWVKTQKYGLMEVLIDVLNELEN